MNMPVEPLPAAPAAESDALASTSSALLDALLEGRSNPHAPVAGCELATLLALDPQTRQAWLRIPAVHGDTAVLGRSTVDLHGPHIGREVLVQFIGGDARRPVVTGVLAGDPGSSVEIAPEQVAVDADGKRMLVTAQEQLVLRCGKASITLTKAGKVLIEGSYVLSRSTGPNRIKGGSVQLN
jgi:Domain of unknown function (DUF6484)